MISLPGGEEASEITSLGLVDVLPIGNYAYTTSHFTATLMVNEKAAPISGSTVKTLERQPDGQWKIKSHIFVRNKFAAALRPTPA